MANSRISVLLISSYVFDWIVIIVAAVVGFIFGNQTPNKRPFSLADPNISFPYVNKEKISTGVLFVVALVIPAVVIFFVALLLVPGPTVPKSLPKSLIWKRKLWEWYTGWTGLALSCATAWVITNGMKNLFGHYRPDLLSRCNPDLENTAKWAVGGIVNTAQGAYLVSASICQQTDKSILDDGFRSFPSGHSSFSAAGLIYLSLFIASKLAITFPFLSPSSVNSATSFSAFPSRMHNTGTSRFRNQNSSYNNDVTQVTQDEGDAFMEPSGHDTRVVAARNQAAAPPVYLLVFAVAPFFAAIYITSTRYSDFRHHGFDVLFGFFIGAVTAVFAFRYYHLPISQGAGWSWGPRSSDRAFWSGVGVGSYVNHTSGVNETGPGRVSKTSNDMAAGPSNGAAPNEHAVDAGQVV